MKLLIAHLHNVAFDYNYQSFISFLLHLLMPSVISLRKRKPERRIILVVVRCHTNDDTVES